MLLKVYQAWNRQPLWKYIPNILPNSRVCRKEARYYGIHNRSTNTTTQINQQKETTARFAPTSVAKA